MRRFLTHLHRHSHILRPCQPPSRVPTTKTNLPFLRLLSDDASPPPDAAPSPSPAPPPPTDDTEPTPTFADVPTKEYLRRINAGLVEGDDSEMPSVIEAIFQREHAGGHSDTDEEIDSKLDVLLERLVDEYEVSDQELLENFEESHETNQELNDLYNARQYVEQKFRQNKALNMDDIKWDAITKGPSPKERLRMMKEYSKEELRGVAKKHWKEVKDCAKKNKLEVDVNLDLDLDDATWDDMIKEEQTKLSNMKECEDTLEGMLQWDKIIPDELKEKSEAKFNELEDMCERGELEPEQAYELFKEFEDKMVAEYTAVMEAESPTADELSEPDNKSVKLNDPPGAGPVLRWESTIVFAPTGVAWHPKNRKVKLSVTVKDLGLSRHAFRRLREVVGKRYNSGKDELTITSERFDHREENRKDCLRTLYALVEDAMKADVLADDARNAYVKGRLKANSQFMDRLKTKTQKLRVAA